MQVLHTEQRYQRIVKKIKKLMLKYADMSDETLQSQTALFREQLANGASLRQLLPEAYAAICVAAERVLGMAPFDVQILGAVVMEYNNIAEMKTGEGKTLTAVMQMYLHGLTGPGNFLITANEYLANRDAEQMGKLYRWMGLSVASGVAKEGENPKNRDLKKIYQSDIVYTTNSALGFDYLFDNLATTPAKQYIQAFNFALIDEADAVLLDTAETPLVISGVPRVQSNFYEVADSVVKLMVEDEDYERSDDLKKIWFTPQGIVKMEQYFDIDNLLSDEWKDLYRHTLLALKANYTLQRDRDYVVDHDEVVLIDSENGRELTGMKMQAGMHQAVEAKEHVEISKQQRAMASITYQNLFRMFKQLAGMTGTASSDAAEFMEVYNLAVVKIPTHRPNQRIDYPDQLYITNDAKLFASLEVVKDEHAKGRPVLVETGSLSLSNLYSRLLLREKIPHSVLNARSAAKEAEIVAQAGEYGAVTVATSMAGRGTDINISKDVVNLGGLLVLGTERMLNPRVDNQLRGRAGRQGNPGESVFYSSLEDKIVVENAPKRVLKFAKKHAGDQQQALKKHGRFHHVIDRAQKVVANQQRANRFETLQYGEIFRVQRDSVYEYRNALMRSNNLQPVIEKFIKKVLKQYAHAYKHGDTTLEPINFIYENIDSAYEGTLDLKQLSQRELMQTLQKLVQEQMEKKHQELPAQPQWIYYQRLCLLKAVDDVWVDQVDALETLKVLTRNRSIAQRNPLFEYQKEAQKSYQQMRTKMERQSIQNLMQAEIKPKKDGTVDVQFP
ncbi:preprotein translocase subunit SecA [Weissella uvarum]|uniref:accessory Sec system translocase SecA2 n=1 Tax=Weissella uvarum TaxID=1479233 RepID=UPI0019617B30|nr:accessory Sec system translocase SecA2 [Weissella uvarum]MBM7616678.1 preprotein translocase subunit SecA [Weissella uvarum]MCM0594868.1 accessory Sec system translocase SecA2 [Weissella uvarum]